MSDSIGKKLKDARQGAGHSVSDVVHATRITESQILGLESDDYSVFASLAYARSFLNIYSSYLGVDANEVLQAMAKPGLSDFRGAPLSPKIDMVPQDTIIPIVKGLPEVRRRRQVKSVLVPLLMLGMVLLLPATFLAGKRLGAAESQPAGPSTGSAPGSEAIEVIAGADVPVRDPIRERKPSDGSLPSNPVRPPVPNPELDALISGSPSSPAVRR